MFTLIIYHFSISLNIWVRGMRLQRLCATVFLWTKNALWFHLRKISLEMSCMMKTFENGHNWCRILGLWLWLWNKSHSSRRKTAAYPRPKQYKVTGDFFLSATMGLFITSILHSQRVNTKYKRVALRRL